jgi:hypothetical protein
LLKNLLSVSLVRCLKAFLMSCAANTQHIAPVRALEYSWMGNQLRLAADSQEAVKNNLAVAAEELAREDVPAHAAEAQLASVVHLEMDGQEQLVVTAREGKTVLVASSEVCKPVFAADCAVGLVYTEVA